MSQNFADETSRSLQFADRAKKAVVYAQPPPAQPKQSTRELAAKLQELYELVAAQGGRVDEIEQMALLAQQVGGASGSNDIPQLHRQNSSHSSLSVGQLQASVHKIQDLEYELQNPIY